MRKAWKLFRAVVSALLLVVVLLPAALYVLLSLNPVQEGVRIAAETELSNLLGADVSIGYVRIHPFRRLNVDDVNVTIGTDTIARIGTISAGIEIMPLITRQQFVVDYALVDGLDLAVTRPQPDAPLNIQPILDRLKSDNKGPHKQFSLEINTIIVRRAAARYDVLSVPPADSLRFDPSHIAVRDLAVNAFIPVLTDKTYIINLDHLSFEERSGFSLEKLTGNFTFAPDSLSVADLSLALPNSRLSFRPIGMAYSSPDKILQNLTNKPLIIATGSDCLLYPPDISQFVPVLGILDSVIGFGLEAEVSTDAIALRSLEIEDVSGNAFNASFSGNVRGLADKDSLKYDLAEGRISINGPELKSMLGNIIPSGISKELNKMPDLRFRLNGTGTVAAGHVDIHSAGTPGQITARASYRHFGHIYKLSGDVDIKELNIGLLTSDSKLGKLDAAISGNATLARKIVDAHVDADIDRFDFKGYSYTGTEVAFDLSKDNKAQVSLNINDPSAQLMAYGIYDCGPDPTLHATALANNIDLVSMNLFDKYPGKRLSAKLNVEVTDFDPRNLAAEVRLNDIAWTDSLGQGIRIPLVNATATAGEYSNTLELSSPFISGKLLGNYDFARLIPTLKGMAAHFMPALGWEMPSSDEDKETDRSNIFRFDFDLKPCHEISQLINLPFTIEYDGNISGQVDSSTGYADILVDLPYISQGNKLIEFTSAFAKLDIANDKSMVYATTQMPTKKGDMNLAAVITGANNKIDTRIEWGLQRSIPINGTLDVSAELYRLVSDADSRFPVEASVNFLPGSINFGEDTWNIEKSQIDITADNIFVKDFALDTGRQRIEIDGSAGDNPDDMLSVGLNNIRLIHIFETLEINNVLIDGNATGRITAKNLLTKEPILECPRLHVDSIGYNSCYFGDADVLARWEGERRAIFLDANLDGFEGKKSHIYGDIYPMSESLDLNFVADSIPVGFLRPFMAAFTSSISGRATGRCRLFGTFRDLDLEGDVFADNVKIKVDFTNVTYSATDSIHIRPGSIDLKDITIRDPEGHTANLNGYVRHTFFNAPRFKFDITDARDLLCYNVNSRLNPDWYGTIYGNGNAAIDGHPGVVNIGVKMATGPRSSFTFVLSDRLDAENYSFLNFRDVTPDSIRPVVADNDPTPTAIKKIKNRLGQQNEDSPSDYNMDIVVDATPDATVTLVVDPVGGDEIKAQGSGSLHMVYRSANNDLNMWGKYTVQTGKYQFTLQDIIIKDFTIKNGSEIQFDGDPYGVKTKLSAYYATNANLTDLDESFQQDKEVARTNVPVHALMNVSGDIRQPAIDFDMEFPTLTSDTYRKVKSIVSTPDMMNRQIIYLLALNRFYTPDYMASTTKGNELFSVASSTISSQLGNMLGKLSENWSIAPNLRSDRGDFSDVEVDVALSSRLLNNRLLFNGNFGYRDKALNNDQFIGDFDIEYLLNKSGTWRLKAYNRYNDRNYYVRSALTTQGVGIMLRRDFDSMLSFLHPKKKKKKKNEPAATDTTETSKKALPVKILHNNDTDSIK